MIARNRGKKLLKIVQYARNNFKNQDELLNTSVQEETDEEDIVNDFQFTMSVEEDLEPGRRCFSPTIESSPLK